MNNNDKAWKIESIKSGSPDDLFEAIITSEQGTKLIAQVPTMETAEEIVNLKYERDVYLALLGQVNSAITYNSDREAQDGLYALPAGLAQSIYMALMHGLPWQSADHEGGRTMRAADCCPRCGANNWRDAIVPDTLEICNVCGNSR